MQGVRCLWALAVAGLWASACGGGEAARTPTLVDRLRVLAVTAEPPEIAPLQTATLRVLAVDPEARDLGYLFLACDPILSPDPGAPVFTPCEEAANLQDPDAARSLFERGEVRLLSLDLASSEAVYRPPRDEKDEPVDLFQGLSPADPRRRMGVSVMVLVLVAPLEDLEQAFVDPDSADLAALDTAIALKRITVSQAPEPNHNPDLVGLSSGGVRFTDRSAFGFPAGVDVPLAALVSDESFEHYVRLLPDGRNEERDETITVSWYSTAGRFGRRRTTAGEANLFRGPGPEGPPPVPQDGRVRLWAVARDGRGGTDWLSIDGVLIQ